MKLYPEYSNLNLKAIHQEILETWQKEMTFEKSVSQREGNESFVFFEGPPSANGMPGIHHVLSRSIKDLFCRYQTLKGKQVIRKAGWDTHGLPIELGVEKELGITKEDIGKRISIAEYNEACRKAVMRYTTHWNALTKEMGYWVDMNDPYITYKTKYIESVWWLLKQLWNKNLLYKGYTIQPYSPKAGTGLSSHELNQPGCYRNVKDTSVVAQFEIEETEKSSILFGRSKVYFLAWTTTPWTLPSNTALAVGAKIEYVRIKSFNPYTFVQVEVVLAKSLVYKYFKKEAENLPFENFEPTNKFIPWFLVDEFTGESLIGLKYKQLLPFALPISGAENAFRVIAGDFVSTEDGTGIVHIAPTFGADDARVAAQSQIPPMLVPDENGNPVPLVDLQGKFTSHMGEFAGRYVKNEYYNEGTAPERSVDVDLAIWLKSNNKAFKVEKYEHSYPHCWRTDKPILYYPLDSWFIKATDARETMIKHNSSINWKPKSTGDGRFGNWLLNLNDWNLSRSRYWGIPLPIWSTELGDEVLVIGSLEELKKACEKSVAAGIMKSNPLANFVPGIMEEENYDSIDLHRPYVDSIVLVSSDGREMKRELDLIDVWFDSGSMPYAQWHYPFENKELFEKAFPADFIAEGVDQTRGWFYTLHAIASMISDKPAYKNVVSNGLVLDKDGQKMSKRLGNAIDPFTTISQYGADALRWYMVSNSQPWDNLRFDVSGIEEVQRKFFGTLYNTYAFFALYANLDGFRYETSCPDDHLSELDNWIYSELHSLIVEVDAAYTDYEPTKAARAIQYFTIENLSNWYVRLSRRRFWKGEYGDDKQAAYSTLFDCLETLSLLIAPIAPFFADRLYRDLTQNSLKSKKESVHLADFPKINHLKINSKLQWQMRKAQKIVSLALGIRKKEKIRVRQPLSRMVVPILNQTEKLGIEQVAEIIKAEVNVKSLEFLTDASGLIVKKAKPNFKTLGPKVGPSIKALSEMVAGFGNLEISEFERNGQKEIRLNGEPFMLEAGDLEILAQDIPGWQVGVDGDTTVALDIQINHSLWQEGIARELVNRIQNLRKESGFEVTDRIMVGLALDELAFNAILEHEEFIKNEVLANKIEPISEHQQELGIEIELENHKGRLYLERA